MNSVTGALIPPDIPRAELSRGGILKPALRLEHPAALCFRQHRPFCAFVASTRRYMGFWIARFAGAHVVCFGSCFVGVHVLIS